MSTDAGTAAPEAGIHRLGRDGRQAFWLAFGIIGALLLLLTVLAFFQPDGHISRPGTASALAVWVAITGLAISRSRQIRLEILEDGFRYVGLFRTSHLRYEDIAGFRHAVGRYGGRSGEVLGVLCDAAGRERVRVTAYLERPKRVREWIQEHFRDLDAADLADERKVVKSKETADRLDSARGLAMIINAVGALLALLVLLGSAVGVVGPRWIVIGGILLAIPIAALAVRARYGRLVSFENTPYRSRFARIELGLLMPMLAAWGISACAPPVHILEALPMAVGAGALFFLALRRWGGQLLANTLMAIVFALLSLNYGYGAICFVNAAFDRSVPVLQDVVVRKVSRGRGEGTIVVSLPSERGATRSLEVPKPLGPVFSPGRPAKALIMPGALGIAWIAAVAPAR